MGVAASGALRWRFFAEGPVRFAPAVGNGKVYAGSDDGYLYCLSLAEGKLLWRVHGAPDDRPARHHLGNARLVSFWPVRGGPVLAEGRVYFAAGIWPTMGVFVAAVDAETGRIAWRNGELGGLVFAVDSLSPIEGQKLQRLGEPPSDGLLPSTILAIDARTGQLRWSVAPAKPYRTYGMGAWTALRANDDWLAFAAGCNLLLAGKFNRASAYEAADGTPVWEAAIGGGQPWILRSDSFLSQSGAVFDTRTGKPLGQQFPLSRAGCNYAVANEFLILLRDHSASFVATENGHKQALYAIRSGCSNSLVAADGLLSVPNFAVGCVCNYPIQTSFAMVHQPEAAAWIAPTP